MEILKEIHFQLSEIAAVIYDPYSESIECKHQFVHLNFLVRPLLHSNELSAPQLTHPEELNELGFQVNDHLLFSFVAWDHVSWPGNDFYEGERVTDDGVKAAATDVMKVVTGYSGRYDPSSNCYLPPSPYDTWDQLIEVKQLNFPSDNCSLKVFDI